MPNRTLLLRALPLVLLAGASALWWSLRDHETAEPAAPPRIVDDAADRPSDEAALELERERPVAEVPQAELEAPRLLGTVRDDLGAPLHDFAIELRPLRRAPPPLDLRTGSAHEFRAADGAFVLADLAPGAWIVTATQGSRSARTEVALERADVSIELVLPRAARITGRVEDARGRAVAGARVCATAVEPERPPHAAHAPRSASTDDSGGFELADLPPARFTLEAGAPGHGGSERVDVELASGAERTDLRLRLRAPGRIVGRAFDARGAADAGRQLALALPAGCGRPANAGATCDEAGRFELGGLAPGEHRLQRVARADELAARGSSPEHDRFLAELATGTRIALQEGETVEVELGSPFPSGVRVFGDLLGAEQAERPLFLELEPITETASSRRFAFPDARGGYELLLARGGEHALRVEGREGTLLARTVTIAESGSQRLDVELGTGAVAGVVIDSSSAAGAACEVWLARDVDDPGVTARARRRPRTRSTDELGRFAFERVEAGSYSLVAGSQGGGSRAALRVSVSDAQRVDGLVLEIGAAGELEVEVLGPTGALAGVVVRALESDRTTPNVRSSRPTDARGITRFDSLAPAPAAWSLRAEQGTLACGWSEPVELPSGERARARLELRESAHVSVRVRGARAPGAWLRVVDARERELARAWARSEPGALEPALVALGPLPLGSFTLRAEDALGRAASVPLRIGTTGAVAPVEIELSD